MQFLITAYDGKDDKALDRRLAARDSHLARGKTFSDLGNILKGGAIISDAGAMIGSALLVEFDSREEVDKWLEEDPYVAGNVWNEITVVQVKLQLIPLFVGPSVVWGLVFAIPAGEEDPCEDNGKGNGWKWVLHG